MKRLINSWHNVSLVLAVVTALIAIFFAEDLVQKLLPASIVILFLHFFEEFGFPGGFPWMGMKVLMGSKEMNSTKWNCNNLNSMFGNWSFLLLVYAAALVLPDVHFLLLAAMIFSLLELVMHLILFNVKQRTIYNPGLVTGVFGLAPISIYYFVNVFDKNFYVWSDYILAPLWCVVVFWFSFRSPLYWGLGKLKGYKLTAQSAYGVRYANAHNLK
ncbi:MAG: HXXEE domain-containing protein [Selenomonadaceae bacterium]|nr:HXXEE domain-containing protein [Selenomonadaceae bacterium]MBQ9497172.1 HXXEE domain-containing protein [Selenomonadaceae bacterium]